MRLGVAGLQLDSLVERAHRLGRAFAADQRDAQRVERLGPARRGADGALERYHGFGVAARAQQLHPVIEGAGRATSVYPVKEPHAALLRRVAASAPPSARDLSLGGATAGQHQGAP